MTGHPIKTKSDIACCSLAASRRGFVPGFRPENQATVRRKTARLVRQGWRRQRHICKHSAQPRLSGLPRSVAVPLTRCAPVQAVKNLATVSTGGRFFCTIEYARSEPGQPSRPARAASPATSTRSRTMRQVRYSFSTQPKYGTRNGDSHAKKPEPPHQSQATLRAVLARFRRCPRRNTRRPHGQDPQLERATQPTPIFAVAATHYWHS